MFGEKNVKLRKFYKQKLVQMGVMRSFRNSCITGNRDRYVKNRV